MRKGINYDTGFVSAGSTTREPFDVRTVRASSTTRFSVLSAKQLWVNPDCGLKTRRWEEVRPALVAMVEAARIARRTLA